MTAPSPSPTPAAAETVEAGPAAEVAPATEPAAEAAAEPAAEAAAAAAPTEKTTDIVAGQGGVMTDEVGVVTGDLTLRSELTGNDLLIRVQYKDADEWYTVTGAKTTLRDPGDIDAVHSVVVGILNRPEG
jgi:hypothetical protein